MKRPPSPKLCELRAKLQRLAADGSTEHERHSAKVRLERLEGRIDFAIPVVMTGDIFATAAIPVRGDFHALKITMTADAPVAFFVKWAVEAGFQIECRWRTQPNRTMTLAAGIYPRSVPNVSKAAKHLAGSFEALWLAFLALPGATEQDCRCFMLGLLDGATGDERKQGESLPPKRAETPAKKGRRKAIALAPALSIHPYAVALPLGARVRLSAPPADLEADLMDAEKRARLAENSDIESFRPPPFPDLEPCDRAEAKKKLKTLVKKLAKKYP